MTRIQLIISICLLIPLTSLAQLFTLHPPNTTRLVETDFSIDCSILASEITIRWRKDRSVLSPSSSSYEINTVTTSTGLSSQFHIFSGTFSDTGIYSCLAYNGSTFLEESRPGTLTIAGPVQYIVSPLDQVVYLNQPIVLNCRVQGGPLPTLKWTYDVAEGTIDVISGGIISIFTNALSSYEITSVLSITNAQSSHDSTYHCETENSYGTADSTARITVQNQEIQPVSVTRPVNGATYTLIAGNINSITLPCTASGLPKPSLQWVFPSSSQTARVSTNQNTLIPSLYIAAPNLQDAGVYTCNANNTLTADSASIEVFIIETPVISASSDSTVNAGSAVTLHCSATGTPMPTVTLTHPNTTVLILDQNGYVTISETSYRDEGTYTCLATVYTLSVERTFVITVLSGPIFITPPSDTGIGVGQDATLYCIVSGTPEPTITWSHNIYTILSAPIASRLRIVNVHSSDEGLYTCMAKNEYASINASATLTIYSMPQFAVTPTSILASIGDSVKFYCSGTANTATIEWYVDNQKILNVGVKYFVLIDGSLVISDLEFSDANTYTCRISNPAGYLEAIAILNVIQRPYFTQTPQDQTVVPGTQVTFSCKASGIPEPTLSWKHESSNDTIQTGGKFTVIPLLSSTIVLNISNVALSEAGEYTCIANNGLESMVSASLSILSVPQVDITPATQSAVLGLPFILTCAIIYSVPFPSFQWYKDAVILTTDPRVLSFTNGSLVIDNVTRSDAGVYLCFAINDEGTDTAQARVNVVIRPSFTTTPTSHIVALGSDIEIPCNSEGVPNPVTSWLLPDNTTAPNDEHFSWKLQPNGPLKISNSVASDQGTYTCVTTNVAGKNYIYIFLTVQVQPNIPTNVSIVVLEADRARISWVVPFNGYSNITGYVVQQQLVGGSEIGESQLIWVYSGVEEGEIDSALVTSLIPYEFYRFRIAAVNTIGMSNYSMLTESIQLFPSNPPAPENVTTSAINSTAILLTWQPPTYTYGTIEYYEISWGLADTENPNTTSVQQGLQHTFTSLSFFTQYMFSIRAINDNPSGGTFQGIFSTPVFQFTGEEPPIGPPLNVTVKTAIGGIYIEWSAPASELRQGLIIAYNLFYRESQLNLLFPTLPPLAINQTNHSTDILNTFQKELIEYYRLGNLSYTRLSIPVKSSVNSYSFSLSGVLRKEYYYEIKLQSINSAGIGPNSSVHAAKSGKNFVNLVQIIVPSTVVPITFLLCLVLCIFSVPIVYTYYRNWEESSTNRKPYRDTGSARRPLVAPTTALQESNFETENRGFDDIIRKPSATGAKRDSPPGKEESYLVAINEINRQIMQSVGESDQEATPSDSQYSDSDEGSGSMSGINTEVFTNKHAESPGALYNYDSVIPKLGEERVNGNETTKQTDFDDDISGRIREVPVLQAEKYSDDDDRLSDSQTPADFYPHENSDLSDDERVSYADYIKSLSGQQEPQPNPESEISISQYSHISDEFTKAKRQVASLKLQDKQVKLEKKRLDQEKKLREKIALRERKAREMRAKTERKEREKEAKQRLKQRQQGYLPPISLDPDLKYKGMVTTPVNKNRDVLF